MPTVSAGTPEAPAGAKVPGKCKWKVENAEQKFAQGSGNEMIKLKLRLFNYETKEQGIAYENLVFTEKALWRIHQFVASAGHYPGEDVNYDLQADDVVGWTGDADVGLRKGNDDKEYNEVIAFTFEKGQEAKNGALPPAGDTSDDTPSYDNTDDDLPF